MSDQPPRYECRQTFTVESGGYGEWHDDGTAMRQRIEADNWRKQICIKQRPYKLPVPRPKVTA